MYTRFGVHDSGSFPVACFLLNEGQLPSTWEYQMNQATNQTSNDAVFVSLISGPEGKDCVAVELANGTLFMMSPAQARSLATSLITAVNRAEVKASLQVSTNLWRRRGEPDARLSTVAG